MKKGALFHLTPETIKLIETLAEKQCVSKSEIVARAAWYLATLPARLEEATDNAMSNPESGCQKALQAQTEEIKNMITELKELIIKNNH